MEWFAKFWSGSTKAKILVLIGVVALVIVLAGLFGG